MFRRNISPPWLHFQHSRGNHWAMMALTWIHPIMSFIKKREHPRYCVRVRVFGWICVRVCLRVAVKVGYWWEAFWFQLASGRPLCSNARAGQAGEEGRGERGEGRGCWGEGSGRAGEGRTSEQQRAAGAIIPPNAPCLQPCLQWLSGEWQIECTHAKGYLGDQVLFSGVGAAQAACLQRPVWTLVRSVQQQRRYSAADSAELGTLCVAGGHALCNRPCAVWTLNTHRHDTGGGGAERRLEWDCSPVWRTIDPLAWSLLRLHAHLHLAPAILLSCICSTCNALTLMFSVGSWRPPVPH